MINQRIAVIDLETASGDPASACQIGWSYVFYNEADHMWTASGAGQHLIRPPFNSQLNEQYHHISQNATVTAEPFHIVWERMSQIFRNLGITHLASFNAAFDAAVFWGSLLGLPSPESERGVDPLTASKSMLHAVNNPDDQVVRFGCVLRKLRAERVLERTYRLGDACAALGIHLGKAHNASDDAQAAAMLLALLLNEPQIYATSKTPEAGQVFHSNDLWHFPPEAGGCRPFNDDQQDGTQHNLLWGVANDGRIIDSELAIARAEHYGEQLNRSAPNRASALTQPLASTAV